MPNILIVPGLNGSGPAHWQSWFQRQLPEAVRVEQSNWDDPDLPRWANTVQGAINAARTPVWIIAHSFGCLATAMAASQCSERIAGAMLVAPADPDKFNVAQLLPNQALGFPSVVVASTNDPWMQLSTAAWWAERWGSRFINIGRAGHINADAGFGPWPAGLALFEQLRGAQSDLPLGALEVDAPRITFENIRLGNSPISGQGIFATRAIAAGTEIGAFTGKEVASPTQHSVCLDGRHIETDSILRYLNHACTPNAAFRGRLLVARRSIPVDEEITIDYRMTEAELSAPFACNCGDPQCKGEL